MQGQRPPHRHLGGPAPVVRPRHFGPVAAIDEQQRQLCRPRPRHLDRLPYHQDDAGLETGLPDRTAGKRERVDGPGERVDDLGVMVRPPGLEFLRAPVVVDAEQERPGPAGRLPEVDGRFPAVRPDLQQGAEATGPGDQAGIV